MSKLLQNLWREKTSASFLLFYVNAIFIPVLYPVTPAFIASPLLHLQCFLLVALGLYIRSSPTHKGAVDKTFLLLCVYFQVSKHLSIQSGLVARAAAGEAEAVKLDGEVPVVVDEDSAKEAFQCPKRTYDWRERKCHDPPSSLTFQSLFRQTYHRCNAMPLTGFTNLPKPIVPMFSFSVLANLIALSNPYLTLVWLVVHWLHLTRNDLGYSNIGLMTGGLGWVGGLFWALYNGRDVRPVTALLFLLHPGADCLVAEMVARAYHRDAFDITSTGQPQSHMPPRKLLGSCTRFESGCAFYTSIMPFARQLECVCNPNSAQNPCQTRADHMRAEIPTSDGGLLSQNFYATFWEG